MIQVRLPESLESLPRAEHFPSQRHRWNTNEVQFSSFLSCYDIGRYHLAFRYFFCPKITRIMFAPLQMGSIVVGWTNSNFEIFWDFLGFETVEFDCNHRWILYVSRERLPFSFTFQLKRNGRRNANDILNSLSITGCNSIARASPNKLWKPTKKRQ